MDDTQPITLPLEDLARNLASFAIDRNDLKELLASVPDDTTLNMTQVEYEIQLLKILSAGWAISFYMPENDKNKGPLAEMFWENIREVAERISEMTVATSGAQVDYFQIIKDRLNFYLEEMQALGETENNPASVMGGTFAKACGNPEDPVALLIGTKMVTLTLASIKAYLDAVTIDDTTLN